MRLNLEQLEIREMLAGDLPLLQTPHGQSALITATNLLANAGSTNTSVDIVIVDPPAPNTLTLISPGLWNFSPGPGVLGNQSLSYQLIDNGVPSDPFTAMLEVTNAAPTVTSATIPVLIRGQTYTGLIATFTDLDDAVGHTATLLLDDTIALPTTITPNSTAGYDLTAAITCPTAGPHTLTLTITDPLGAGTTVMQAIMVTPTAAELYAEYLAKVLEADGNYNDAIDDALDEEELAEDANLDVQDAAEIPIQIALDDAHAAHQSGLEATHASIMHTYDVAVMFADGARDARIDQAMTVYFNAEDAAIAARQQAFDDADNAYAQAILNANTAYDDTVNPLLAAMDAAQSALNIDPDDTVLQGALAQALSDFANIEPGAAWIRDQIIADAPNQRISARNDAENTYTSVIESAASAFETESQAANDEYDTTQYDAWVASIDAQDAAEQVQELADQSAENDFEWLMANAEHQFESAQAAVEDEFERDVDAAKNAWTSTEDGAWTTYTTALLDVPGNLAPGSRRDDPPANDATLPKWFSESELVSTPLDPTQATVVDIARLEETAIALVRVDTTAGHSAVYGPARESMAMLIRIVEENAARRADAFDALVRVYEVLMNRPAAEFKSQRGMTDAPNGQRSDNFVRPYFTSRFTSLELADGDNARGLMSTAQRDIDARVGALANGEVRARFASLLLYGPMTGTWTQRTLDAVTVRSSAGDVWAADALNFHLDLLEQALTRETTDALNYMQRVPFIRGRLQLNSYTQGRLDPGPVAEVQQGPAAQGTDPVVALLGISDLYATYARNVLGILDRLPNNNARSRLLNALEVVSGKLVEDGEMRAAAIILREEATAFESWGGNPPSPWYTTVADLVRARANLYEQTAPARIISQLAPALRASVVAAQTYLTGAGAGLPAADRTLLDGLAAESSVQADILQASAENTSLAFTEGLLIQFRDLAVRYLGNVEFEAEPVRNTLGSRDTARPAGYQLWLNRVDQIIYMLRGTARDFSPHTLYGARSVLALSATTYNSHGPAITYSAALAQLTTEMPRLAELLNAYTRISFGFTNGDDTEFTGGKADIVNTLNAAGMNALAANYVQQFIADSRTQQALQMAYRLQERQQQIEWWDALPANIATAASTFAIGLARELPVILVSSALSGGSVGTALAMWRVATGVRLAARTVWAVNFAAAIPIGRAVDRALGRTVDDSFLGTMKQAGLMLGVQAGFSIIGSVGRQAFTALRRALGGNVQQAPIGLDFFAPRNPPLLAPVVPPVASTVLPPTTIVTGLRDRSAFRGMAVTGQTASGASRISAMWRRRYGPSATRRHHLIPQELLRNPNFIRQMQALGYTRTEIKRFVDRQIADLPNIQHMQIHAEGWNDVWRVWLDRNPRFSVSDLRAQVNSMITEFEIPAAALGGPIYGG